MDTLIQRARHADPAAVAVNPKVPREIDDDRDDRARSAIPTGAGSSATALRTALDDDDQAARARRAEQPGRRVDRVGVPARTDEVDATRSRRRSCVRRAEHVDRASDRARSSASRDVERADDAGRQPRRRAAIELALRARRADDATRASAPLRSTRGDRSPYDRHCRRAIRRAPPPQLAPAIDAATAAASQRRPAPDARPSAASPRRRPPQPVDGSLASMQPRPVRRLWIAASARARSPPAAASRGLLRLARDDEATHRADLDRRHDREDVRRAVRRAREPGLGARHHARVARAARRRRSIASR